MSPAISKRMHFSVGITDFLINFEGLHGKPDLYGPFWVSVTLCFSTAICGNLANFIQNQGNPEYKYTPEFERVTSAASAIFGYAFIFPFFISCKCLKNDLHLELVLLLENR